MSTAGEAPCGTAWVCTFLASGLGLAVPSFSLLIGTFADCTGFVAQGTGGSLYSGTVANFGTTYSSYGNGIPTWSPTGTASESKVFRFTYTLPANAPSTVQGGTAALGFTWEAQNS